MARCVPTSVFQRVRHFASDRSACDKQSLHSGQQGGARVQDLLTTTRNPQSPLGKSKLLSAYCCLVNSPNTLSVKAPRQSQSTQAASKLFVVLSYSRHLKNGFFKSHQMYQLIYFLRALKKTTCC